MYPVGDAFLLADGSYEEVPMGIFEVSEANRRAKCLEIKAYDFMVRFEKSFNGYETIGTGFDFVNFCCSACKVAMAQDQSFYESLPNGRENKEVFSNRLYFEGMHIIIIKKSRLKTAGGVYEYIGIYGLDA